jgi:aminoglycoside phosphotransferase (APT) family kinase protein
VSEPVESLLAGIVGPVSSLRRLSGGASRETWAFEADGRAMILQRGGPAAERLDVALQASLLRAAASGGVPVPAVIASEKDWAIVEHVEGETIARKILRDDAFVEARARLVEQAGSALARIHQIPAPDGLDAGDQLERWAAILHAMEPARPALEFGLRWLATHTPKGSERALVHGDFRLGNWVVGPDGLRAVLDWELAHVGDPLEDLGWMCVKAWRYGSPLPAAGLAEREELWDAYERASGRSIDRAAARWWEIFGTVRWGIICLVQAERHLSGAERSVELASIGRRVSAVEWDLLEMLP